MMSNLPEAIIFSGIHVDVANHPITGNIKQAYLARTQRRMTMSNYELQIRRTEQYYDEAIRCAERESIEVLNSVVTGSRLHEIIHNPVDSGIDEG